MLPGKAQLSETADTDPVQIIQDPVALTRADEFERRRTQAGDGGAEPVLGLCAGSRPGGNEPQNLGFRWTPAVEGQQVLEGLGNAYGFIHEPILGSREIRPGRTPLDGGPNPSRPWPAGQGGYPLASGLGVWGLEGEEPAWPQDRTAARPQSREPGPRTGGAGESGFFHRRAGCPGPQNQSSSQMPTGAGPNQPFHLGWISAAFLIRSSSAQALSTVRPSLTTSSTYYKLPPWVVPECAMLLKTKLVQREWLASLEGRSQPILLTMGLVEETRLLAMGDDSRELVPRWVDPARRDRELHVNLCTPGP